MDTKEYFRDWLNVIDLHEIKLALSKINKTRIEPAFSNIFRAFELCDLKDLKIIFLGQDPYPQKGVSTGVAFGNKKGTIELSPSLQVLKEACIDYSVPHGRITFDETLESWAKQGILLLNSSLTVPIGRPNGHTMLWRPFISKLLANLSKQCTGIIYVLFGATAQTFEPYINKQFNYILKAEHPAYFARVHKPMPHKLFTEIDTLMKGLYNQTIKWYEQEN